MANDHTLGVCGHKMVCKSCVVVDEMNRPLGCERLKCPKYTPCKKCGLNKACSECFGRDLTHLHLCKDCNPTVTAEVREKMKQVDNGNLTMPTGTAGRKPTVPGTPPDGLTEEEKDYYLTRWAEYRGYYRNPAAFQVCHAIILEEIVFSSIVALLMESRGDYNKSLEHRKSVCIEALKKLKDQLPEKEADDISDDDRWLSGIYDLFIQEKGLKTRGKVSRIFSKEAVALSQNMPFPSDCDDMSRSCGFTVVELEEAMKRYDMPTHIKNADDLLEFLGFHLRKKYAIDSSEEVMNDDELAPEDLTEPVIDMNEDKVESENAESFREARVDNGNDFDLNEEPSGA